MTTSIANHGSAMGILCRVILGFAGLSCALFGITGSCPLSTRATSLSVTVITGKHPLISKSPGLRIT